MMKEKGFPIHQYVSKTGSSLCIIITKPDCDALKIKEGNLVKIFLRVLKK